MISSGHEQGVWFRIRDLDSGLYSQLPQIAQGFSSEGPSYNRLYCLVDPRQGDVLGVTVLSMAFTISFTSVSSRGSVEKDLLARHRILLRKWV